MSLLQKWKRKFHNETSSFNVNNIDNDKYRNETFKDLKIGVGCYRPLEETNHQNQITNHSTDTSGRYDSFNENVSRKRARDSYDDENHDPKKPRLNVPLVQYGIKKPSQRKLRKILEELFKPEITAEGWEKNNNGFEYHTKIRGKFYYKSGDSIDDAKERCAEKALKELCKFTYERIYWPKELKSFQLDQEFADQIERSVRMHLRCYVFSTKNYFQFS